jgi:hypothetical protein
MGYLFVGLFVWFIGVVVNAFAKRQAVNPGKMALLTVLILMVAGMAVTSSNPGAMGYVMGQALIPVLGFWAASSYYDKKG